MNIKKRKLIILSIISLIYFVLIGVGLLISSNQYKKVEKYESAFTLTLTYDHYEEIDRYNSNHAFLIYVDELNKPLYIDNLLIKYCVTNHIYSATKGVKIKCNIIDSEYDKYSYQISQLTYDDKNVLLQSSYIKKMKNKGALGLAICVALTLSGVITIIYIIVKNISKRNYSKNLSNIMIENYINYEVDNQIITKQQAQELLDSIKDPITANYSNEQLKEMIKNNIYISNDKYWLDYVDLVKEANFEECLNELLMEQLVDNEIRLIYYQQINGKEDVAIFAYKCNNKLVNTLVFKNPYTKKIDIFYEDLVFEAPNEINFTKNEIILLIDAIKRYNKEVDNIINIDNKIINKSK